MTKRRTCLLCGYFLGKDGVNDYYLFNIPREDGRRQQWEKALSVELTKNCCLCEMHFIPQDIIKSKKAKEISSGGKVKQQRVWLRKGALPQKYLQNNGQEPTNQPKEKKELFEGSDEDFTTDDQSTELQEGITLSETPTNNMNDSQQLPKNWYRIQPVSPQNCLIFATFITKFNGNNFQTLPFKEILFVDGHIAINCLGKPISDDTLCGALQTEESLEHVIKQVDKLHLCCGIGPNEDIPNFDRIITWEDALGDWRAENCLLLLGGKSQRCGYCHNFREAALKNDLNNSKKSVKLIIIHKKPVLTS